MGNNFKQRDEGKLLGGITGRGFLPGRSGNVNGRPKTNTNLVNAIRAKVAEVAPDGRTFAQHIAVMLVEESLRGRNRIAAASVILDRLEVGRHSSSISTTSPRILPADLTTSCAATCCTIFGRKMQTNRMQ